MMVDIARDEEGPIAWMQRLVGNWLSHRNWNPEELSRLLEGFDLPPVGHDEEPYVWLLRGLPSGPERFPAETEFAARVAQVLDSEPELGEASPQFLLNLLLLSAGLSSPDQLAEPLWRMYRRGTVSGNWLGYDLRVALRSALTSNQVDARLDPVWRSMLKGKSGLLLGDAYDGFEGIRLMPSPLEGRGRPALEAMGAALGFFASQLTSEAGRRREFRMLLSRLVQTYPGRPTWDRDLIEMADRHSWPVWAIRCLPRLIVHIPGDGRSFIWRPYLDLLRAHSQPCIEGTVCAKELFLCRLSPAEIQFLDTVVPQLEASRRADPDDSENSPLASILHELSNLEEEVRGANQALAYEICKGRLTILRAEAILFELPSEPVEELVEV